MLLDERGVSWKVLLPHHENGQVLACGLGAGEIVGLARSWLRIDCCFPEDTAYDLSATLPPEIFARIKHLDGPLQSDKKYDLIVLGKGKNIFCDFMPLLAEDGVLVLVSYLGCEHKWIELKAAGFGQLLRYGVLPTKQPRIIYPLQNRRLRRKAFDMHSPGSQRSILAMRAIRCLSNFGITAPLTRGSVTIAKRHLGQEKHTLQFWLQEQLHREILDLVVYCGSDTSVRKITLLAVGAEGQDDYIVKIADTKTATEAIKRETNALKILAATTIPAVIPRVLLSSPWRGYNIQVQTTLSKSTGQINYLTENHLRFLASLANIGRQRIRLADSRIWHQLVDDLKNTDTTLPSPVKKLARVVCSSDFAKKKIFTHQLHGDFTPWNMAIHNDSLAIWDWEDGESQGLAFFDIFHFIIRKAILLGPWPGTANILQEIKDVCSVLRTKTAFSAQIDHITSLQIWIVLEYLRNPHPKLLRIATVLETTHA